MVDKIIIIFIKHWIATIIRILWFEIKYSSILRLSY